MVVCPMRTTDQYGSALRADHGLCIVIDQYEEHVRSIPDNISKLLNDNSYKRCVRFFTLTQMITELLNQF